MLHRFPSHQQPHKSEPPAREPAEVLVGFCNRKRPIHKRDLLHTGKKRKRSKQIKKTPHPSSVEGLKSSHSLAMHGKTLYSFSLTSRGFSQKPSELFKCVAPSGFEGNLVMPPTFTPRNRRVRPLESTNQGPRVLRVSLEGSSGGKLGQPAWAAKSK